MPEEFAAAYRAAYDEALHAQPSGAHPVGSGSAPGAVEGPEVRARLRSSPWFPPVLLVTLALLLVLGAYAVGRLA